MAQLARNNLLSGKVGIVTGATRGIGAAIARNLASKGCSLVLGYTSKSSKPLAKDLVLEFEQQFGVSAVPAQGDIGREETASKIVQAAQETFANGKKGKFQIDIIVNNAGTADLKPLGNINVDDFNKIYSTNVLGPIFLLQACLPHLPTDRSGRIVNVSSVGSALGLREQTVYAGSKGALEAMTRVWARELAERATVNSVNPGPVLSDIFRGCSDDIKKMLGQWNQVSPLASVRPEDDETVRQWEQFGGRPAYAAEVAGVVAMLCSPDAGWTTGSIVSANGGMRFSY